MLHYCSGNILYGIRCVLHGNSVSRMLPHFWKRLVMYVHMKTIFYSLVALSVEFIALFTEKSDMSKSYFTIEMCLQLKTILQTQKLY
jgi:hypothetical protein